MHVILVCLSVYFSDNCVLLIKASVGYILLYRITISLNKRLMSSYNLSRSMELLGALHMKISFVCLGVFVPLENILTHLETSPLPAKGYKF